jgi:hypothetical protein
MVLARVLNSAALSASLLVTASHVPRSRMQGQGRCARRSAQGGESPPPTFPSVSSHLWPRNANALPPSQLHLSARTAATSSRLGRGNRLPATRLAQEITEGTRMLRLKGLVLDGGVDVLRVGTSARPALLEKVHLRACPTAFKKACEEYAIVLIRELPSRLEFATRPRPYDLTTVSALRGANERQHSAGEPAKKVSV